MASDNNSSNTSSGIGVGGALLVLFVALKLTHVINWSWWWVVAPAWIPLGIVAAVLAILAFVAVLRVVFGDRHGQRGRR